MATQVQNLENRLPQRILQADGVIEFIVGTGLLLASETVGRWLSVSATAISISGVGTLAFGSWLMYISRRNITRRTLQTIAIINLTGVIMGSFVLVLDWNLFANEGRWILGLVVATVLVLGLTELHTAG